MSHFLCVFILEEAQTECSSTGIALPGANVSPIDEREGFLVQANRYRPS